MSQNSSQEKCVKEEKEEKEAKEKVNGKLFHKKVLPCVKYVSAGVINFVLSFKARMVINSLHLVHASSVREEPQSVNQKKHRY